MIREAALKGSFVQDSGTGSGDAVGKFSGFAIPTNGATIDRIEINGDSTTNVLTTYVKTVGGVLQGGELIMTSEDEHFTLISMTGGSINPINAA